MGVGVVVVKSPEPRVVDSCAAALAVGGREAAAGW